MRKVICLQIATVFWLGWVTISPATDLTWGYYVRQTKINIAEPLVPKPSSSDVELAIEKLKIHKSPGNDHIPAELIKAGGRTIRSENHKLVISIWNKEKLPDERKESIISHVNKKTIKRIVVIIGAYHFCQLHTNFYPTYCSQGYLHMQRKLLGIINVDFDTRGQLFI